MRTLSQQWSGAAPSTLRHRAGPPQTFCRCHGDAAGNTLNGDGGATPSTSEQNGNGANGANGAASVSKARTGTTSAVPIAPPGRPLTRTTSPFISTDTMDNERYGWPRRSDMYMLRVDGNVCARTLVKGTGRLQLAYPSSHQYMMVWKQRPKTVMVIKKLGDELLGQLYEVVTYLHEELGLNVIVESDVHRRVSERGGLNGVLTYTPEQGRRLGEFVDFLVCLGGDGVLLHTAMLFGGNVPPIIAFHLGSLGFLSQHRFEDMRQSLYGVVHGSLAMQETQCSVPDCENAGGSLVSLRMRLICEITRQGKRLVDMRTEVMNEVVLDRGPSSFLTNIDVFESGNYLTCVQADGLMIATPTGSTAYSAAAGGSMVHPNVPAILFTPICPHSLNFRPVVLPDYADIVLRVADDARSGAWVSFDGKLRQELRQGDSMRVRMSPNPVATINNVDQTQDWVTSLDRCFGWSNRISQQQLAD